METEKYIEEGLMFLVCVVKLVWTYYFGY